MSKNCAPRCQITVRVIISATETVVRRNVDHKTFSFGSEITDSLWNKCIYGVIAGLAIVYNAVLCINIMILEYL